MNKLILSLKREYWEYRRVVLGIPIVLSVLVIVGSAAVTMHEKYGSNKTESSVISQQNVIENPELLPRADEPAERVPAKPALTQEQLQQQTPFRFMAIYLAVAWLAAFYYLLSSLNTDRMDQSILFWKSVPVSETHHVLSKFIFGAFGFSTVAVLIGWLVYLVLLALGFGAMNSVDGGDTWQYVERTFDASRLFAWPIIAMVAAVIWGTPFFSYAILVSAVAKRRPFLPMILVPIIIVVVEKVLFSTNHVVGF